MSKYDETFPQNIKKFLLSPISTYCNLYQRQNQIIKNISEGQDIENSPGIEYYNEFPYNKEEFKEKCSQVLDYFPITFLKNQYNMVIDNFNPENFIIQDIQVNYGDRITFNKENNICFEEWRNIIDVFDCKNILLSLHKLFCNDVYEIKVGNENFSNFTRIYFNEKNKSIIDKIEFNQIDNSNKTSCTCTRSNEDNKIITIITIGNGDDQKTETKNENLYYENNEYDSTSATTKVETETIKTDNKSDYYEKNFESYNISPESNISLGKKEYENNKNRNYNEEWHKKDLEDGGYEFKCHKYLDDGCGNKINIEHGKKYDKNDNLEYEYTDTYKYNVINGDELTTKIGFDKYNKWNCRNYRNRIKNFSHVCNEASNSKEKMEWKETWDEEDNMKKCKKWGRSEYEEWEEAWEEIYNPETDDSIKKCYKKCKKLKEDKEWYETWTEKNNGKSNCEKTCYKMNRVGGNKFENYWGNIIVNYLDNKRMNYVGYVTNDQRKEYINYTYENTNN